MRLLVIIYLWLCYV